MSAADFVPASGDLAALRAAAAGCRGCDLYRSATQTVFGTGSARARMVLVGEQPGDVEDRRGIPFVGPAGTVLQRAVDDAGIARSDLWVTNTVKHFKFSQSAPGKRRIHAKPDLAEVAACTPWLEAELARVAPQVTVCLGATAAQALLGPAFRVTRSRGEVLDWPTAGDRPPRPGRVLATLHPSAVLRTPADQRAAAYAGLVADLRVAAAALAG